MMTGGPALDDSSLGTYHVVQSPIPSVLTCNPLPSGDDSPALVWLVDAHVQQLNNLRNTLNMCTF